MANRRFDSAKACSFWTFVLVFPVTETTGLCVGQPSDNGLVLPTCSSCRLYGFFSIRLFAA